MRNRYQDGARRYRQRSDTDGDAALACDGPGRRCGRASDSDLAAYTGFVEDSGEGRWTIVAAIDEGVPAPVITASLFERFESRGLGEFADKVLSAMRSEFGGHAEKKD